jgi:hypothetical protein
MVYKVKLLRWKRQRKVLLLKEWNLTKSKDLLKSVEIKKVRKPLKQLATLLPTLLLTWLNKKLFMKSFHMLLMLESNTYQNLFHQEISLRKKLDLKAKLRLSNPQRIKQNLLKMENLLLKKYLKLLKVLQLIQRTQQLDQEIKRDKKLFMKSFNMLKILKSNTYQNLFHQEISLRKKLDLKAKLRLSNPHKIKQNLLRMVTLLLKKHQLELLLPLFPIVINLRKLQNLKLTRQCKNSQAQVNLDQLLWKPRKLTERSFMTYKKLLMMVEFHQET